MNKLIIAALGLCLACSMTNQVQYARLATQAVEQASEAIYIAQSTQSMLSNLLADQTEASDSSGKLLGDDVPAYVDYIAAEALAKMAYGEAGICSRTEQAATMWCALNRVDSPEYPNTVIEVIEQRNQFQGYSSTNPVNKDLLNLANEVMLYWQEGDDTGRVLPREYMYFIGDGKHNHFYDAWKNGNEWTWMDNTIYD